MKIKISLICEAVKDKDPCWLYDAMNVMLVYIVAHRGNSC